VGASTFTSRCARLLLGSSAQSETALSPLRGIVPSMALSAPRPAAFEVRRLPCHRDEAVDRFYLRATGDGWSLLNSDGEVVFCGFGLAGRRRCLEYAHEIGVMVVFA
jgi:hypothetical protein